MLEHAIITAGDLMTRDVAMVRPEMSLLEAAKLMVQHSVSGLPVVDEAGHVVGMLTEGDLVRWHEDYTDKQAHWLDMLGEGFDLAPTFLEAVEGERRKVKAVMSPNVVTVNEETSAREMANLMHSRGIKRVPVLRDGKLVGVVARSDLVRAFVKRLSEQQTSLQERRGIDEALRHRREEKRP